MEKELNINDGWEEIVNRTDRQDRIEAFYAARKQHRIDKLYHKAGTCALGVVTMGTLYLTGLLSGWVAIPVAAVLMNFVCFTMGRVRELEK